MTATSEPGRASDWDDTGPLPRYSGDSKVTATFHPECQIAPLRGQNEPQSDVQPVRELPDATDAGEALVQQIAEALAEHAWHDYDGECACGWFPEGGQTGSNVKLHSEHVARAVLPLVEAQVAPLLDEVAASRAREAALRQDIVDFGLTHGLADSRPNCPVCGNGEEGCCVCQQMRRAESAESALLRVSELADEWDATAYKLPPGYPMTVNEFCRHWFKAPVRAVLDSARVGAADTQPEGAGVNAADGGFVLRKDNLEDLRAEVSRLAGEALKLKAAQARLAALGEAVTDLCWKATPMGETADGDTHAYILPKGTVHRLIGVAQGIGINASFRAASTPAPSDEIELGESVKALAAEWSAQWSSETSRGLSGFITLQAAAEALDRVRTTPTTGSKVDAAPEADLYTEGGTLRWDAAVKIADLYEESQRRKAADATPESGEGR